MTVLSSRPKTDLSPEQEEQLSDGAHFPALSEELPGWLSVKNEDGIHILYPKHTADPYKTKFLTYRDFT